MAKIVDVTAENFDKEVAKSEVPVLVDYWASWCAPCKAMTPTLEEIAEEAQGKFKVGKVNIEDYPELANRAGILNIPTFTLLKDGEEVERITGVTPKNKILTIIEGYI